MNHCVTLSDVSNLRAATSRHAIEYDQSRQGSQMEKPYLDEVLSLSPLLHEQST